MLRAIACDGDAPAFRSVGELYGWAGGSGRLPAFDEPARGELEVEVIAGGTGAPFIAGWGFEFVAWIHPITS